MQDGLAAGTSVSALLERLPGGPATELAQGQRTDRVRIVGTGIELGAVARRQRKHFGDRVVLEQGDRQTPGVGLVQGQPFAQVERCRLV